jgi:hypothetical protein
VVSEQLNLDKNKLKLIHKGKSIGLEDSEALTKYKFKPLDKIMALGIPKTVDPGLTLLTSFEKNNLLKFSKTFNELKNDVTELEKNFLEGLTVVLLKN